jgi:hypothetical protein
MLAGILSLLGADQSASSEIPSPANLTLEVWADSLHNFVGNGDVPRLGPEGWQYWADRISDHPSFRQKGVPNAAGFPSWLDWAETTYGLMMS